MIGTSDGLTVPFPVAPASRGRLESSSLIVVRRPAEVVTAGALHHVRYVKGHFFTGTPPLQSALFTALIGRLAAARFGLPGDRLATARLR